MCTRRMAVLSAAAVGLLVVLAWLLGARSVYAAQGADGSSTITFRGVAADGTKVVATSEITEITTSRLCSIDPAADAGAGRLFLTFYAQTPATIGSDPNFEGLNGVPLAGLHLVLSDGAVVPALSTDSSGGLLTGNYCFAVPSATKQATLYAAAGTVNALEFSGPKGEDNALTTITFRPTEADLVVAQPPSSTTTLPSRSTVSNHKVSRSRPPRRLPASRIALVSPLAIGSAAGATGIVVLVLVIPLWRRRSYRRAEEQGRVLIDAPPVLLSPRVPPAVRAPGTPAKNETQRSIPEVFVKVLGPIEIEGLVRPTTKSPVRELLVFLALHPGRRFASTELRSAIWVEGRNEPSSSTFHNYLSELRRSLPHGSLLKDGYRFSLTEAVSSDWGVFLALVQGDDARAERLADALGLIRGAPFEGASAGRNDPFGWAGEFSYRIEAVVERTAHELAGIGFDSGDVVLADTGVTRALRAVPSSIVVRQDHLRLGATLGGRRELTRRMETARSSMGGDLAAFEPLASELGWDER